MVEEKSWNKKKLDCSYYDDGSNEFEKTINGYYRLIGGDNDKYDKETSRRLASFGEELLRKRSYEKFTTFKADHDDMINRKPFATYFHFVNIIYFLFLERLPLGIYQTTRFSDFQSFRDS